VPPIHKGVPCGLGLAFVILFYTMKVVCYFDGSVVMSESGFYHTVYGFKFEIDILPYSFRVIVI